VNSDGLALAATLCCWLLLKMRVSSLVNALAGTIDYDIACCLLCVVLLSMFEFSLCPPLGIELYVSTIIQTVPTVSNYNTNKVRFPNCIVQRVFFSRARGPYNFFCKR
jgi:hypothetical protein